MTGLLGANGAGKTTLLDLLAGDRAPERGRVLLDGLPLTDVPMARWASRIARLAHRPGLYLDLTARENLALLAALHGRVLTPAEVSEHLSAMGLAASDVDRPVRQFSRGMQQRAALARVRASTADVWLLDEPSTGLDASGLELLRAVLADARTRGVAVVCATHDPALLELCDRRWRVSHGSVEAA